MGLEPTTICLGSKHSTTELRPLSERRGIGMPVGKYIKAYPRRCSYHRLKPAPLKHESRLGVGGGDYRPARPRICSTALDRSSLITTG